jgi:hypothetical protein
MARLCSSRRFQVRDAAVPDWSYRTLFRPAIFALPTKSARDLALMAIGTLARTPLGNRVVDFLGHMRPEAELARNVFGQPLRRDAAGETIVVDFDSTSCTPASNRLSRASASGISTALCSSQPRSSIATSNCTG